MNIKLLKQMVKIYEVIYVLDQQKGTTGLSRKSVTIKTDLVSEEAILVPTAFMSAG